MKHWGNLFTWATRVKMVENDQTFILLQVLKAVKIKKF